MKHHANQGHRPESVAEAIVRAEEHLLRKFMQDAEFARRNLLMDAPVLITRENIRDVRVLLL